MFKNFQENNFPFKVIDKINWKLNILLMKLFKMSCIATMIKKKIKIMNTFIDDLEMFINSIRNN